MEKDTIHVVISASAGVAGVIVGLIAPWIKWKTEKGKIRLENQREFVRVMRQEIAKETFELNAFLETPHYSQLRTHISRRLRTQIELKTDHAVIVVVDGFGRGAGIQNFKNEMLDEISRLEKKWNLL